MKQMKKSLNHDLPDLYDSYDSKNQANQHNQKNQGSDNMQGWEIKKLGQVCDFQNGFAFKSNTYKETGLPILRITNIQNQSLELNDLVYFDAKDYKENFDRFKVYKDDLVVAMSGATTGKLGINTTDTVFYLNQRVNKFIPKKEILKPYLYYFLST